MGAAVFRFRLVVLSIGEFGTGVFGLLVLLAVPVSCIFVRVGGTGGINGFHGFVCPRRMLLGFGAAGVKLDAIGAVVGLCCSGFLVVGAVRLGLLVWPVDSTRRLVVMGSWGSLRLGAVD